MAKRKKNTENTVESLVLGGIIGVALSALIAKSNRGEYSVLGALAGAAIMASTKAYENAQLTEIPLVIEEGDALYKVYANGTRKLIKQLPKSDKSLPKKFTLK